MGHWVPGKGTSEGLILLGKSNSTNTTIIQPNLVYPSCPELSYLPTSLPKKINFPFIRSAWEQFSYNLQCKFISQTSDAWLYSLAKCDNISERNSPICIQGLIIPHMNIQCPEHILMVLFHLKEVKLIITTIKSSQ